MIINRINEPAYIVWHSAMDGNTEKGIDNDTTATDLDGLARERGLFSIGCHHVVRKDGTLEAGREEGLPGADTPGLNGRCIVIVFSGHGDIAAHTEAQRKRAIEQTVETMERYRIPPTRVIGFREINKLVDAGELDAKFRVEGTSPGTLVDMREVRQALRDRVGEMSEPEAPAPEWPLSFDEAGERVNERVQTLQEAINAMVKAGNVPEGIELLKADGWAGLETSTAIHALTGHYLLGDPRAE